MEDYSYEGQRCQAIIFLIVVSLLALVCFVDGAAIIIGVSLFGGSILLGIILSLYIIIKGDES